MIRNRAPRSPVRNKQEAARATPETGHRGNQLMIAKVLTCADDAMQAGVERKLIEWDTRAADRERRAAAQAKRERKMAKRAGATTC